MNVTLISAVMVVASGTPTTTVELRAEAQTLGEAREQVDLYLYENGYATYTTMKLARRDESTATFIVTL